jgi:hypothetical protein
LILDSTLEGGAVSHAARTEPIRLITDDATGTPDGYVPGACNIGPWEIRRRRTIAVAGFAGAAVLLAVARMTRDSFLLAIGPTLIAVLLPI